MRNIPRLYQCKNEHGHVLWTAITAARPAEAVGWWRVEVVFDDGKPGNKFFNDGDKEIGNGYG